MIEKYSEKEIIEGCLRNNRFYQGLLYKRYAPPLLRLCLRKMVDRDTAMMVVNNGFLKVYKNLDSYQATGAFEGWIHRIVYRSILDYFQGETLVRKNTQYIDVEKETEETLLDKLYYEDLLRLAKQLPKATYRVFFMYLVEGYKHREIAETLGISVGTSKWHLAEAKKGIKNILHLNENSYAEE